MLIPLRHGTLAYPTIVTQTLQAGISHENYQEDASGAIDILPHMTEANAVVHVIRDLSGVRDSWASEREVGLVG